MVSAEVQVETLLDSRSEAMRAKDIERLMSVYSPDVVYFDVVPPLQYIGSAQLRDRFLHWFGGWQGAIRQEIHDLRISASGDIAATSMLIRAGGTLKSGLEVDRWLRTTSCCQRSDRGWQIAHEHVSLPVDMANGRAVMDLIP
ncbi:YybH family protein [Devosia nitrariae]|uniref:SnoaL-like domain-containing protein n=1 Tax=Devosia nitrariae TaxID=2071872 RepID=A0ABQ5W8X5_9HYPH|nr:nuclear transport factor 2 family protein [Devosia nitrariae]GLQ56284.1 hypothetical protein GCM10010862_35430 [Devosia nitrariae]